MWRSLLALLWTLALAVPADAHRLNLFARTEAGTITGYGFFSGGGRPRGAAIIITDSAGKQIHRSTTNEDGSFSWRPPTPGNYTISLDTGEGHVARRTVSIGAPTLGTEPPATGGLDSNSSTGTHTSDGKALEKLIEDAVARAVERQIEPLRESIAHYEASLRFKDFIAGIAMIIGLAGIAMWFAAGKRRP